MQKVAILGCGRVSQRHMEVFRDEVKGAQVLLVADTVQDKADLRARELGCKPVYTAEEVFNNEDIDVVVVLSESGNHADHSMEALKAGKHVIVEKPPALIPSQIQELESYAKSKELMYAVIFQNRYNPAMKQLKEAFDEGRFGKKVLSTVRLRWCRYQDYYEDGWHGSWKMDGGVINQQAIHHVDALRWICGPIESVVAAQHNSLNALEAEDTTVATVKFCDGSLGAIEATTAARPEDFEASLSIVGEKGMVVVGGIALNKVETWQFIEGRSEDEFVPEKYSQEVPSGYGLSHGPLIQDIMDRLNQGVLEPPITGADTIPTVQLVHAIYRSAETGSWVNLSDNPLSQRLGR